jgi:hypothetical protein
MNDKLLTEIYEEKNEWIGPVNDLVLQEIIKNHSTGGKVRSLKKRVTTPHTMKAVDQESAEWLVASENLRREPKDAEYFFGEEQEQVFEEATRFDAHNDNTVDYMLAMGSVSQNKNEFKPRSASQPMQVDSFSNEAFLVPKYEDEQTKLFLAASEGFDNETARQYLVQPYQSQSQIEESIRRGLFSYKYEEPQDIVQFKKFLRSLAQELTRREKSPVSQLRKVPQVN